MRFTIVELQFTTLTVHISTWICPYKDKRIEFLSLVFHGEVVEWFKATVLKTVDVNSIREFESHLLRSFGKIPKWSRGRFAKALGE